MDSYLHAEWRTFTDKGCLPSANPHVPILLTPPRSHGCTYVATLSGFPLYLGDSGRQFPIYFMTRHVQTCLGSESFNAEAYRMTSSSRSLVRNPYGRGFYWNTPVSEPARPIFDISTGETEHLLSQSNHTYTLLRTVFFMWYKATTNISPVLV